MKLTKKRLEAFLQSIEDSAYDYVASRSTAYQRDMRFYISGRIDAGVYLGVFDDIPNYVLGYADISVGSKIDDICKKAMDRYLANAFSWDAIRDVINNDLRPLLESYLTPSARKLLGIKEVQDARD